MRFGLVIFDCDGVLVDSEPLAAAEFSRALHAVGLPWSAETVDARFRGRRLGDCLAIVEAELGAALPAAFADDLEARTRARFERDLRPVEDVRAAIEYIRDSLGIPICVASSGALRTVRHSLTITGLGDLFGQALFSGTDVPRGKPAPDLFLAAAAATGVSPRRCLVIEDSGAGITGALAAGMEVLAYRGPPAPRHPRRRDFDRMDALPELLVAGEPGPDVSGC